MKLTADQGIAFVSQVDSFTMKKLAPAYAGASFFIMICMGIERPAPRSGVKNSPGDCFSGRGRFPGFRSAVRRTVKRSPALYGSPCEKERSEKNALFLFPGKWHTAMDISGTCIPRVSRDLFLAASLFRFLLYNVDGFQKLQTLVDIFAAVPRGLFAQWFVFFRKKK
jgi:hypothetical protein